jgi:FkbM family methyltransferase
MEDPSDVKTVRSVIRVLRQDKRPLRRLASHALLRLPFDPARFVQVHVRDYRIYLHRTTLSAEFWYDSNTRGGDDEFLRAFLRESDTYIDVGANIGTTVIPAARRITTGRVIAFEPHPRTYSFLQENLRLNGITHVDARNCAVGSRPGWIGFTDKLTDDQNHPTDDRSALQVKVEVLDQVTRDMDRIALIKIDVEGYEKEVLAGASETLRKTECVYFELCEAHVQRFGTCNTDLLALLEDHGFRLFRRTKQGDLEPVDRNYQQAVRIENALAIRHPDSFVERTGWRMKSD